MRTNLREPTDRTAGTVGVQAALGSSTTIPSTLTPPPEISRSASRLLRANPARTNSSLIAHAIAPDEFGQLAVGQLFTLHGALEMVARSAGRLGTVVTRNDFLGQTFLGFHRVGSAGEQLGRQAIALRLSPESRQPRVRRNGLVADFHELAELLGRRFGDADVVAERLAHLLHAVKTDQ